MAQGNANYLTRGLKAWLANRRPPSATQVTQKGFVSVGSMTGWIIFLQRVEQVDLNTGDSRHRNWRMYLYSTFGIAGKDKLNKRSNKGWIGLNTNWTSWANWTNEGIKNRCLNRRTGKELISWGKHWEQGRDDETDAGQVWREKQAGEDHRILGTTRNNKMKTGQWQFCDTSKLNISELNHICYVFGIIKQRWVNVGIQAC